MLALAAEVGFTPNGAGRGLSTARAQTLGFVSIASGSPPYGIPSIC